jgi:hypothetical protein
MPTSRLVLLLPALLLATACGSGRLVPSSGEPTPSSAPAPEPSPEPAPEPTTTAAAPPAQAPPPDYSPPPAPTPAETTATPPAATAYAPYGAQPSAPAQTPVQIRRIGQYSQSGLGAAERLVIRDDTTYARLWARLAVGGPRPPVDFSRDAVVVVAGGQRSTGGYSIAVDQALRTGSELSLNVVETTPAPGCIMTQALTQPVDIVVVAAADVRSWGFSEQMVAQNCS